jgi:methionyl-tRNA formyltransferase
VPRRIGVAATGLIGADVLEGLAADHDIAFALTRPDRPRGRGLEVGPPPAKVTAERLGIPVLQPERLGPEVDLPDVDTVVVAAYGLLIPESLFGKGVWLNVHPSLLPRWRGAAPVERAIMAGDRETGVTIHRTVAELDAGPIAAQEAFPIEPEDDAGSVYRRSAQVAVELLRQVLPDPVFVPQPEDGVTYAEKITAADRELDWSRPPEENLNRIRALSPHIGARAELQGRRVLVWKARLEDGRLEPVEVQPEGRRRMTYDEFLRGLR